MRNSPPVSTLPSSASPSAIDCSVLGALTILGDFWTLGILRTIISGSTRFAAIQSELGIASNILTDRLSRLVAAGVLQRAPYGSGSRHAYVLTGAGSDLAPVVLALKTWGDRHLRGGQPLTTWRHRSCSATAQLEVRCPDCETALELRDLESVRCSQPREIDE